MHELLDIDWPTYFHRLSDYDLHELAAWLAEAGLEVSEFTDLIDRAYALDVHISNEWRGRPLAFVASCGRPAVAGYAYRKRHFAGYLAALEYAQMSGALPGEVALEELAPVCLLRPVRRTEVDLLDALHRIQRSAP